MARVTVLVRDLAVEDTPGGSPHTTFRLSWCESIPDSDFWGLREVAGKTLDEALAAGEVAMGIAPGSLKRMLEGLEKMSARYHAAKEARGEK